MTLRRVGGKVRGRTGISRLPVKKTELSGVYVESGRGLGERELEDAGEGGWDVEDLDGDWKNATHCAEYERSIESSLCSDDSVSPQVDDTPQHLEFLKIMIGLVPIHAINPAHVGLSLVDS